MMIREQLKITLKKQLSNSDLETIINCTNLAIDSTSYALLQKAQPASAAVERSFSMLSIFLRKDRNFVKKYMMLYFYLNKNPLTSLLTKQPIGEYFSFSFN